MHIDVWSDLVCPWCYLGKRRLERALSQIAWADEVVVRWRAYQLDPAATEQPSDLRTTLEAKYGAGTFDAMIGRITNLGRDEGIDYRFALAQRVNTRRGHRLVAWTWDDRGAEAQDRVVERLFRAYFSEGENLADAATLARLADDAGVGVPPDVLGPGVHDDAVRADLDEVVTYGLRGVPAFVVEGRHLISGAQDVGTFRRALEAIRRESPDPSRTPHSG